MLRHVRHILEMIRFSHTVFALPFALLAAVMAWYLRAGEEFALMSYNDLLALRERAWPAHKFTFVVFLAVRWQEVLGILVCMVAARSAAMSFNRLADRRIDAENPRTSKRHLPAGILSVSAVILFTVVCSAGLVAGTLLFLPNWLPLYLSLPLLAFLFLYSYAKRFTALAHFWLGAALMAAPLSAWIALRGDAVLANPADILPALVLGIAVLLWVAGFDIIYACQDETFDRQARLRSIPAMLGTPAALRLAAACHAGMIVALFVLPLVSRSLSLGWTYLAGVAAVAVLLIYEHAIVRPDDLTRVNVAFFHVNAVVGIGLFVVSSIDLLVL